MSRGYNLPDNVNPFDANAPWNQEQEEDEGIDVLCPKCAGSGEGFVSESKCPKCKGSGIIKVLGG